MSPTFMRRVAHYAAFRDTYGREPLTTSDDPEERSLGAWLSGQRSLARQGQLPLKHSIPIYAVNLDWLPTRRSQQSFGEVLSDYRAFVTEFGRNPKVVAAPGDERSLGQWLSNQRSIARRGELSADRVAMLESVNPDWKRTRQSHDRFHERLDNYLDFRAEHDRDPSQMSNDEYEKGLGWWLTGNRRDHRRGQLDDERVAALDDANPGWMGAHGTTLHESYVASANDYRDFVAAHGRDPSKSSVRPVDERRLGAWITQQRYSARQGLLHDERRTLLDNINPDWMGSEPLGRQVRHEERLATYLHFLDRHDRAPSLGATNRDERVIGHWIVNQRRLDNEGQLADERRAALDEADPQWRYRDARRRHELYDEHVAAYWRMWTRDKVDPSSGSDDPDEESLALWLSSQRTQARKGMLPPERKAKLDAVNPGWQRITLRAAAESHANRVLEYRNFRDEHDRDPKSNSTDATEQSLSYWLTGQRTSSRRDELAADRRQALDAVSPDWGTPQR